MKREPLLPTETVDIYYIDTYLINDDAVPISILNNDEYKRYNSYLMDRSRKEFLIGRYLLKTVLGNYLNTGPYKINFRENKFGKLFLKDSVRHNKISFNLSHSYGMVVAAFVSDTDIGVDVEKINEDITGIVRRFFSLEEQRYLNKYEYPVQKLLSYQIWTLKEAYIKAKGLGLSTPLNSFSIFAELGTSFFTTRIAGDYIISVAINNVEKKKYNFRVFKVF